MQDSILIINERDNVAVALRDIAAGEAAVWRGEVVVTARESIPASHKIALRDINPGDEIIKYGETVGVSTTLIRPGSWVHGHNLESGRWRNQGG